jgi:hypothetical protein
MIDRAIWFFEPLGTVASDRQQVLGQADIVLAANTVETLSYRAVTAAVMLSPVSFASSRASRCASSFLIFSPTGNCST